MNVPVTFDISKDKTLLLLWSGGYDSTLILIEALRQGYNINTLYVNLKNNDLKSLREMYKRTLILKKLEHKFSKQIQDKIVEVDVTRQNFDELRYVQPTLWLIQSLLYTSIKNDYICFGYLKTSVFWHISHNWRDAFHSLKKCLIISEKIEPLFPLEWTTKLECHKYFKLYFKDIYDLCHTCETPILKKGLIVDCGKCKPCENLKHTNILLKKEKEIKSDNS